MHDEPNPWTTHASKFEYDNPWIRVTEYDVLKTLRDDLKHDVRVLGVTDELTPIKQAAEDFKPHVVFNLLEAFHEIGTFDQNVVSYLELLRLSYTGCNPRGMILARDKALALMAQGKTVKAATAAQAAPAGH